MMRTPSPNNRNFDGADVSATLRGIRSDSLRSSGVSDTYCAYPLNLGSAEVPIIELLLAIPIPEAYLADAERFSFMGTPKAQALYSIISFIMRMFHRRYVLRAKPKKKSDAVVTEPVADAAATAEAAGGAPAHETRANDAAGEHVAGHDEDDTSMDDEYSSDMDEPNRDETHAVTDVRVPPAVAEAPAAEAEQQKEKVDANYVINMVHKGTTFRKVRFFMEQMIYGPGISSGYILWVACYDKSCFGSIFLSLLAYNGIFHANPNSMEKLAQKGSLMEKASMKIFSAAEYVHCLRTCSSAVTVPDRVINSEDTIDFNSPYHLKNFFSVENAKLVFPEVSLEDGSPIHWNWRCPPNTPRSFGRSPQNSCYAEFIREIPPTEVDSPDTLRGFRPYLIEAACQILTSEGTLPRLTRIDPATGHPVARPYTKAEIVANYGVMNEIRRAAIDDIIHMLHNKMMSTPKEYLNPLFTKHDYFYYVSNIVKEKRKNNATTEEIHDIFRLMYNDFSSNLVDEGIHLNCSKAQRDIFVRYLNMKLPQKYEPMMYRQSSDLDPMTDVLFQFCENLQKYLRLHKGDRFTLALYFFLTGLPIDTLDAEDLQNVAAMGPQQKGKSTGARIVNDIIAPERIYTLNNVTNNALHVLGNWNGYIVVCDEADVARLLGIDLNTKSGAPPQSSMTTLSNDLKTLYTNGGWLLITSYDIADKENRSNKRTLFQARTTWWFMQNCQIRTIMASPLASRLFFMRYTDEGKSLLDGDELQNMDGKVSKNTKEGTSEFGRAFIDFCQFVDRLTFIYNHFVMMGAFDPIDTDLILATLNSMNISLRKAGFTPYDDRLKGRGITLIRRFSVWLCIATWAGTEVSRTYVDRCKKLTLDFDVLVEIDRFIKANTPTNTAIAFVMSVFSGENTKDRITVIHQLLKKYYRLNNTRFKQNPAHDDKTYVLSPFLSKADMLNELTDLSDVPMSPEDLDNYYYELTKYVMKDNHGKTVHAMRFVRNVEGKLVTEFSIKFLEMEQGNTIREAYLAMLRDCLNLQCTKPTKVLTMFPLTYIHHGITVRLGGVLQPLQLGRGRNVLTYLVPSTSRNREDEPFIMHHYADDFGTQKDATRHYTLALRREMNNMLAIANGDIAAELPAYPEAFARRICDKVQGQREHKKYASMCGNIIPHYYVVTDMVAQERVMDEQSAVDAIKACTGANHVPAATTLAYRQLLNFYVLWNDFLYKRWMLYINKQHWLKNVLDKKYMPKAHRRELAIHHVERETNVGKVAHAFRSIHRLRKTLTDFHPDLSRLIGPSFSEHLSEAVNLPKMRHIFYILQTYANAKGIRPTNVLLDRFNSTEFMLTLESIEKVIGVEKETGHLNVLTRDGKFKPELYHPTLTDIQQYNAVNDNDPLVIIVRMKDLFCASVDGTYNHLPAEQRKAVEEYHTALVAWYKVVYVYALLLEYKMEAILYATFEDDFAVTVMNDHIDRLSNYFVSLNPKGAFNTLKKVSKTLRETLCNVSEISKVLDLCKMSNPAGLLRAEIDCETLVAYGALYDTHLGTLDGIYANASAISKALRDIVFESDAPGDDQRYLRSQYDITAIVTDRWPSRDRTMEPNIKANYAAAGAPQSQRELTVKRAFIENICDDISDASASHENANKRARIDRASIY